MRIHWTSAVADTNHMADNGKDTEQATLIIQRCLVNRDDRWGTYYIKDRGKETQRVKQTTRPSPKLIQRLTRAGKPMPYCGPDQIADHIEGREMPIGLHAISRGDTCRWVAWDIDRHFDSTPPELPRSALSAIIGTVRQTLGLLCLVEDSGGGGWHIWVPLSCPAPAPEAYAVARAVRVAGEDAWLACGDDDPHVEGFPKSETRWNDKANCGGGWFRLPGKHQKRQHVSSLLAPQGKWINGLEMWRWFSLAAKGNTSVRWSAAVAAARAMERQRIASVPSKRRPKRRAASAAKPAHCYDGWTTERLTTQPLRAGERRRREQELVPAVLSGGGSLADAEAAILALYVDASGASSDLGDPPVRAELIDDAPDLVRRLAGRMTYRWASRGEAERARQAFAAVARRRESRGLGGWSAARFARWLDGFYGFLRGRAQAGGYAFLAATVALSTKRPDQPRGPGDYFLKDNGGGYGTVEVALRAPLRVPGGRTRSNCRVTPYKAYLSMLANLSVDGKQLVQIIRPAVRGKLPWLLDCNALPLDWPDAT